MTTESNSLYINGGGTQITYHVVVSGEVGKQNVHDSTDNPKDVIDSNPDGESYIAGWTMGEGDGYWFTGDILAVNYGPPGSEGNVRLNGEQMTLSDLQSRAARGGTGWFKVDDWIIDKLSQMGSDIKQWVGLDGDGSDGSGNGDGFVAGLDVVDLASIGMGTAALGLYWTRDGGMLDEPPEDSGGFEKLLLGEPVPSPDSRSGERGGAETDGETEA